MVCHHEDKSQVFLVTKHIKQQATAELNQAKQQVEQLILGE